MSFWYIDETREASSEIPTGAPESVESRGGNLKLPLCKNLSAPLSVASNVPG